VSSSFFAEVVSRVRVASVLLLFILLTST